MNSTLPYHFFCLCCNSIVVEQSNLENNWRRFSSYIFLLNRACWDPSHPISLLPPMIDALLDLILSLHRLLFLIISYCLLERSASMNIERAVIGFVLWLLLRFLVFLSSLRCICVYLRNTLDRTIGSTRFSRTPHFNCFMRLFLSFNSSNGLVNRPKERR